MRFPDMRVRHADGRAGTIPAGAEPAPSPMGELVWVVLWDDGTSSIEDDDDLDASLEQGMCDTSPEHIALPSPARHTDRQETYTMTSFSTTATDAVKRALLTDPDALARAVAEALAVAGAQTDWDSSTIEDVLYPLATYAESKGLPTATNAEAPGSLTHWRTVADELGIEHDGTDDEDDEDEDGAL